MAGSCLTESGGIYMLKAKSLGPLSRGQPSVKHRKYEQWLTARNPIVQSSKESECHAVALLLALVFAEFGFALFVEGAHAFLRFLGVVVEL